MSSKPIQNKSIEHNIKPHTDTEGTSKDATHDHVDLFIDNYTLEDLKQLFGIGNSYSQEDLDGALIRLLKQYSSLHEEKYLIFVRNAWDKLRANIAQPLTGVSTTNRELNGNEANKVLIPSSVGQMGSVGTSTGLQQEGMTTLGNTLGGSSAALVPQPTIIQSSDDESGTEADTEADTDGYMSLSSMEQDNLLYKLYKSHKKSKSKSKSHHSKKNVLEGFQSGKKVKEGLTTDSNEDADGKKDSKQGGGSGDKDDNKLSKKQIIEYYRKRGINLKRKMKKDQYQFMIEALYKKFITGDPSKEFTYKSMNPFERQKNLYSLVVNTRFRKNYYETSPTNFIYVLPTPMKNVIKMRLASNEIHNCVYPFSNVIGTNEFTIETYEINAVGVPVNEQRHVIRIRNGSYTNTQLQNFLNNEVFANHPVLSRVQCEAHRITSKFRFILNPNYAGSPGSQPRFNLDFRLEKDPERNIQLNVGWMLGFRKPYYSFETDYTPKNMVSFEKMEGFEPEGIFNAIGTSYFYLHINDFNYSNKRIFEVAYEDTFINSTDIMAKIQNVATTATLIYNDSSDRQYKQREYYGPVTIERLEIKLLDEFGRELHFTANDFSFTLEFETFYMPPNKEHQNLIR